MRRGHFAVARRAPSRQGTCWRGWVASRQLRWFWRAQSACCAGKTFSQPLWSLPGLAATLTLKLDSLSAVFIFVTGSVLFPASIFAGGELNRESARRYHECVAVHGDSCSALYASIVLIFIAGDVVLFLLAWEVMSILC